MKAKKYEGGPAADSSASLRPDNENARSQTALSPVELGWVLNNLVRKFLQVLASEKGM